MYPCFIFFKESILMLFCINRTGLRSSHRIFQVVFKPAIRTLTATYSSLKNSVHQQALEHWNNVALQDRRGEYSYGYIYGKSTLLARKFQEITGHEKGQRVVSLLPNEVSYVVSQWATWKAGHIAVPLHSSLPPSQLQYFLDDSNAELIVTNEEIADRIHSSIVNQQILALEDSFLTSRCDISLEDAINQKAAKLEKNTKALIVYTSGTTGPPKGVVLTHGNLYHQINCMLDAWGWSDQDVILHCLPLHHIHGIVNALLCPLHCGARVVMMPKFSASETWTHLLNSKPVKTRVNVFMGVPTMYAKLVNEYKTNLCKSPYTSEYIRAYCSQSIRLMISGSAPLPVSVLKEWKDITGHTLLERYGMTEIGMALSNPLKGTRHPGFVGTPFPGVQVCIAQFSPKRDSYEVVCKGDENGSKVTPGFQNEVGELLIKGPNVFLEYWDKKDATLKEFTTDGWFCTGDTAIYSNGNYKILGRTSVDIIKSGGFKISALDIERHLLEHPSIVDVAVVGIPDNIWGEQVAAIVVWQGDLTFHLNDFKAWAKERLPHYQVPSVVKILTDQLPRNAMGKVNKKQLIVDYFAG